MKNYQDICIIAVDSGYGNIKTARTITPTGIKPCDNGTIFGGDVLVYEGKRYLIGAGHKEFIADKEQDNDYYLMTLAAVANELSQSGITTADVHLATGLPLTWVRRQRESFRAYLMQNEQVDLSFRNVDYHIHFVGCSIYPQGYPAVVSNMVSFTGTNLLCDIGNGTMNVMYIINRRPVEGKCWTEKQGVNQCMIAVKNAMLDTFGTKLDDSDIEPILRNGTANIDPTYLDCIVQTARQYVAGIFDTLRRYEYDPRLMKLIIVGGGGCLVRYFGDYDASRVTIMGDICATAKGYEYLAYGEYLRKESA